MSVTEFHAHLWRTVSARRSLKGTVTVLLCCLGNLVEDKLWDFMWEVGRYGQQVRLGLIPVLVSHKFHMDGGAIWGGVAGKC